MKDYRFLIEKYILRDPRLWPEQEIQNYVSKIRGKIAFDIGAYHGQYSKVLCKRFDHVLAFEPDPDAAKFLESLHLDNLRIYQIALSDKDGDTSLYRYDGLFCPGILPVFHLERTVGIEANHDYNGRETLKVRTGTYDDFAADAMVDLVKIDVEGAEFKVLEGMTRAFTNHKVVRVLVELHDQSRRHQLEKLLGDYSFRAFWLDSEHIFGRLDD